MKKHRTTRVPVNSGKGPNGLTELLQKGMRGDAAASSQLVRALDPLLRSVVGRYRLTPADTHDVVQTVWVRFLERHHTIRTPDHALGWLRTTARREAARVLRRRWREQAPAVLAVPVPGPEEWVLRADRALCVWRAAGRLRPRDRRLAALIAHEEASYAVLAAAAGVGVASVGPLRGRCLNRLRRLLAEEGITDAGL